MKLLEVPEGVVVDVFVKPNAKRFELKIEDNELVALCSEVPEKGKVNKELLKELTKIFGNKVELVSGFTSRQKRFLVTGTKTKQVEQILQTI